MYEPISMLYLVEVKHLVSSCIDTGHPDLRLHNLLSVEDSAPTC